MLTEDNLARVRALDAIARAAGPALAQMALAWALRDPRVTSALIGASSVAQLEENVAALDQPRFLRRRAGRDRPVRSRERRRPVARPGDELSRTRQPSAWAIVCRGRGTQWFVFLAPLTAQHGSGQGQHDGVRRGRSPTCRRPRSLAEGG